MVNNEKLDKMDKYKALLSEPGPEVVGELIHEIRRLKRGKGDADARLREKLAALCHDQWSGWMVYLFSKCEQGDDGTLIMPKWAVEQWSCQAGTKYAGLTPKERDSDRKEADKFLAVLSTESSKRGER